MKILCFTRTILAATLVSLTIAEEIPINSLQNSALGNWWFLGPLQKGTDNFDFVGKIEKDPLNYFNKNLDNPFLDNIVNVSSDLKYGFQPIYQIYDNFKKGDIIYAFAFLDAKTRSKEVQFKINSGNTSKIEVFVNGGLKAKHERGNMDEVEFFSDLKKGRNNIVLKIALDDYNPKLVNVFPRIFFWALTEEKVTIYGNVEDSNGNSLANHRVEIYDGERFVTLRTDKNGRYENNFFPFEKNYQARSYYNSKYGYSSTAYVVAGDKHELNISINNGSEFYGTVKNIDNSTPQPGVRLHLKKIDSKNILLNWMQTSDENGNFSFSGLDTGNYYLSYFSDNKRVFVKDKIGNRKKYSVKNNSKLKEDINLPKQVKGSWKNLNLFDGMLSSAVYDLLLASDGKLYIGTFNGLSIYDGQAVTSYNYKDGLPNDALSTLFEDSKGNIWLGYNYNGIVKWNNGNIIRYKNEDGLAGNGISAINEDKDGNMLFGTERGLSVFDGKNFTNYNYKDGLGNGRIKSICVDGKNIWIGQNWPAGELTLFNGVNFKNFKIPQSHQYGMNINTMVIDNNGVLWIGDSNQGLISFDGANFKRYDLRNGLAGNNVYDIYIEDNNHMWIGTESGVSTFDGNNFKILHEYDNSQALNNSEVSSIAKSKDGIYFFGQGVRGVVVYDPSSFRNIEEADGFKNGQVGRIRYDNSNNLWISQWNGGGGLSMLENEQITKRITIDDGLPDSRVTDFVFSKNNDLWIGTPSGLAIYDLDKDKIRTFTKKDGLQDETIRSLALDKNGIIWCYTPSGLIRYDGETFTLYNQDDGLVRPRNIGRVNIDKKGNVIYATYGSGFSIFDGKTFKNYDTKNGMVDGRIWDVGIDSKNNYWFALDGSGVQMYNGESFVHYDVEDGVGAGETWSVFVDDFDLVWIGTFHGGACMFDGLNWNCIDKRDGLVDNTISSIFGTNGNRVWFGGYNGITSYIPKREISNVYIKNVITPQRIYSGNEISNNYYQIEVGNRISFTLNSNSFNTLKEKQKYIVSIKNGTSSIDTLIKSSTFNFHTEEIGNHTLSFKSIDRDLNYSNSEEIKFSVIGPWYVNPATAIPFWGILALMLSFSGYTTNKYLKQRKLSLLLTEESARKDREARKNLEDKNSELLESQKAAEAANEAKSTFLANMSHELRTPLNAIIGYSEMLIEDAEDENEDFIPDLDKINNSGKHLLGLINDILDLSKVESGKMELFIEEFDLRKITEEVEATIKPLVEKNGNKLVVEYKTDVEKISADLTKMRQILLNLLSNSAKFTKDGTITISVVSSKVKEYAVDINISDTGIGMTPDQVDKVFKPFTQADEKTTRKFGGTGLGLTITKMFAEMMGGEINLKSKEGKGTTFTVTIPTKVSDPKKQNMVQNNEITNADLGYTVLVIDDDDNAQDMMRKFLEKQNVSILQAKSGEDGLKLAAEYMPDAITLDVMMPEMDGWEVLTALQANEATKNIPVIMLTMADEPDIGFSLGATDYLTKPVNWDKLSSILNRHKIESDSQTILIVEDDETTREMLKKSLASNDFKVRIAKNGKEGLDKVKESKPGLVLLDLMMPEMDGFEFAEKLRENKDWLDIPVVVITAKDLTSKDHNRLKGNVEAIMQKGSYSKKQLLSEVGERIKQLKKRS